MKFFFRSLLVLAVAAILGLVLYYAVQALPNDSPNPRTNANLQPQNGNNAAENPAPRPERSENDRGGDAVLRLGGAAGVPEELRVEMRVVVHEARRNHVDRDAARGQFPGQ